MEFTESWILFATEDASEFDTPMFINLRRMNRDIFEQYVMSLFGKVCDLFFKS
jgi:hypothetical protein